MILLEGKENKLTSHSHQEASNDQRPSQNCRPRRHRPHHHRRGYAPSLVHALRPLMGAEMERDVQAGDVVQVVGSMETDGNKLIGTVVDTWLQETHIESVWWNIMLSTGQIIQ